MESLVMLGALIGPICIFLIVDRIFRLKENEAILVLVCLYGLVVFGYLFYLTILFVQAGEAIMEVIKAYQTQTVTPTP